MTLRDILSICEGLSDEVMDTKVTVCYSDGHLNFTAPVAALMVHHENQYLYDGEMISESELSIKLQVAQALGEDPTPACQVFLPKNSLVICAKSKF